MQVPPPLLANRIYEMLKIGVSKSLIPWRVGPGSPLHSHQAIESSEPRTLIIVAFMCCAEIHDVQLSFDAEIMFLCVESEKVSSVICFRTIGCLA